MDVDWQQVKEIFSAALECATEERQALLDRACRNQAELRREIETLLEAHDLASRFLVDPVLGKPQSDAAKNRQPSDEGRSIGPYRVLRPLGQGGMGVVYLALRDDDSYRKQVAIKLIQRGLDLRQRIELFRTVCAAVQAAHQSLVIHRDLKPSNILVTADGLPKLLDFGIAKLLDPGLTADTVIATADDEWLMTPQYASPEQLRGENITTASDVDALGLLLYELISGCRAYSLEDSAPAAMMEAVCRQIPQASECPLYRTQRPRTSLESPSAGDRAAPAMPPLARRPRPHRRQGAAQRSGTALLLGGAAHRRCPPPPRRAAHPRAAGHRSLLAEQIRPSQPRLVPGHGVALGLRFGHGLAGRRAAAQTR